VRGETSGAELNNYTADSCGALMPLGCVPTPHMLIRLKVHVRDACGFVHEWDDPRSLTPPDSRKLIRSS
jgi:hypothetical protein